MKYGNGAINSLSYVFITFSFLGKRVCVCYLQNLLLQIKFFNNITSLNSLINKIHVDV